MTIKESITYWTKHRELQQAEQAAFEAWNVAPAGAVRDALWRAWEAASQAVADHTKERGE